VIVAIRAEFIGLLKVLHVFSKHLLAFFAYHDDFSGVGHDFMVLTGVVAFRAVVPLLAAGRSNCKDFVSLEDT